MRFVKKWFALFLAVCVLLPAAAFAVELPEEAGKPLHLLWEIPFGIGMDEVISRVKEKTGFMLAPELEEDGVRRYASLSNDHDGAMRIAGYDASYISTRFYEKEYKADDSGSWGYVYPEPQEEALRCISISWIFGPDTPIEYMANCYAGILFDLERKYGEAEAMSLSITNWSENQLSQYQIKKRDGYVNTEDIILARKDNEQRKLVVTATFNNMEFRMHCESWTNQVYLTFFSESVETDGGTEDLPTYGEALADQAYGIGF